MNCLVVCLIMSFQLHIVNTELNMTLYYIHYDVIYLRQLFSDVSTHKHSLQVDPKVLDGHPVFYDISRVGKILNPLLNLGFKWGVVPGK